MRFLLSCIMWKKFFVMELRNWRLMEWLEVFWFWLLELLLLEIEGLLFLKGRMLEVVFIGELNGFWKYLEVVMRIFLFCV